MGTKKTALFGGAIWCAGLSGGAAGQEFSILTTIDVYAGVYGPYGTYIDDFVSGYVRPDQFDSYPPILSVSTSLGTSSLELTKTTMSVETQTVSGTGTAIIDSHGLTVTKDGVLQLEWDFTDANEFASIRIATGPSSGVVFETDPMSSGTANVDLIAGVRYWLHFEVRVGGTFDLTPRSGFASATLVPGPGAAALAGVVGLLAARRRR